MFKNRNSKNLSSISSLVKNLENLAVQKFVEFTGVSF